MGCTVSTSGAGGPGGTSPGSSTAFADGVDAVAVVDIADGAVTVSGAVFRTAAEAGLRPSVDGMAVSVAAESPDPAIEEDSFLARVSDDIDDDGRGLTAGEVVLDDAVRPVEGLAEPIGVVDAAVDTVESPEVDSASRPDVGVDAADAAEVELDLLEPGEVIAAGDNGLEVVAARLAASLFVAAPVASGRSSADAPVECFADVADPSSAWAMNAPFAIAAPMPTVIAPAPNHSWKPRTFVRAFRAG